MILIDFLRDLLGADCDFPGCTGEPKPLVVNGGIAWLCSEHIVEVLVQMETADGRTEA